MLKKYNIQNYLFHKLLHTLQYFPLENVSSISLISRAVEARFRKFHCIGGHLFLDTDQVKLFLALQIEEINSN